MSASNNLVGEVTDAIAASDPAAAVRFTRSFQQRETEPRAVIRDLNRYWREELSRLNSSTISARACLIDDIEPTDWIRYFKKLVLETIVINHLPRG